MNLPHLSLLGPPVLRWEGREWAFGAERRFQLLAWLALQGDWVGREQAAALFWPEQGQAAARRNLRKLLFKLHDLAGLPALEEQRGALRWRVATDLQRFEAALAGGRMPEAAQLWRGEPLAGIDSDGAAPFADWLAAERRRWGQRWRDALLAAAREAADPLSALHFGQQLLALDPTDEDALRVCLQAHASAGAPAQARRLYRTFENHLHDQLGLAPAAATRALLDAAPPPATGFVGRRAELRRLASLMQQPSIRWVTITGPGGIGKTRLQQQALPELAAVDESPCWVPLDDLSDSSQIAARLAERLGLVLSGAQPPLQQVQGALQGRRTLLALDNLEHLAGAGHLLAGLLQGCPGLRILATSRERLGLADEKLFVLTGLPYPSADEADDAEAFDAVQLFVQCARRQQPRQDPLADRPALVALCQAVDGLPLALELAAVWTRHFSVAELLRDLRAGADLQADAFDGTHPPRHRSLARVFEHSWARLGAAERRVLARLSVLQGSFTREAAASIAAAGVPLLAALIDKSLLRHAAEERPAADSLQRLTLHPLTQQFAAARLADDGDEAGAAQQAHRNWFFGVLARFPIAERARQAAFYRATLPDLPNIAAAWRGAVLEGRRDLLAAGALPLMRLFESTGAWDDGLALLQLCGPLLQQQPVALAALRFCAATLDFRAGRFAAALEAARQALPVLRRHGGPRLHKGVLNLLGLANWQLGRLTVAAHCFDQALALARADADREGEAAFLGNTALIAKARGRYDEALAALEAALQATEGDAEKSTVHNNLGNLYRSLGQHRQAIDTLNRGLQLLGPQRRGRHRGYLLSNLALAHFDAGDVARAESFALQAHEAIRQGGEPSLAASVDALLARVAMRRGELAHARTLLASAARDAQQRGQPGPLVAAAIHWAEWLQFSGQPEHAEAVLAMALVHPATTAPDRALALSLQCGGVVAESTTLDQSIDSLLAGG